jgi:hypothetical protein
MKKIILFCALLSSFISQAQGQGDLTIYSNTGAKFYVILNGVRQNITPQTNVKVTGLSSPWYACRIISEDKSINIEKNVGVKFDTLTTYRVVDKKGKYKLRFFSESSLGTSTSSPDQTVIVYHTEEMPVTNNNQEDISINNGVNTTSTTTTSTTIINEENGGNGENINMNINIGETGINMNVNTTGMENENFSTSTTGGTSTYYEETTTTTTTSSSNGNSFSNENTTNDAGNNSYDNCFTSDSDIKSLQAQVENESFEDDQLKVANLAAKNKCMSVSQIKVITNTFTFEDNKLNFLKTAYNNCTDKSNYYQLMESLTFSSDKDELEKFLSNK